VKNCDEHVVGSDKHMQHSEKMIAKYVLTFGLDETRNFLPLQNDESHTQKRGSMFYYIQIQQMFFAKGLTMEGYFYLDSINSNSH